jgi:hypothetical protein
MEELLVKLAKMQKDTAPVKLSIGYTDNKGFVKSDAVVIYDCPPKIVTELVQDSSLMVEMREGGLLVYSNPVHNR